MKKKLHLGDCLEILPTLPANRIDTCITDPPYFLINDSGSGFMGKEWDGIIGLWKYLWNDKQFVSFVARFLNAMQVEKSMEGENIVPENVNTTPEEKKTSNNAYIVGKISNTQTKNGSSVQGIAITKDVLLDLLKELSPNHTKTLEKSLRGEGKNVLFVIPILLRQQENKNIVQKIVTTLLKASELEEAKITFTKTEIQKRADAIEGMIGISSERGSTKETIGDVDIVENIVLIKKSNVTTLNHTEKVKIIRNLTLLLCVYLAITKWSKISDILIRTFFKVTFQEVFRILKPGGLVLAFGGTRTWHQLATSLEDAGFEIRDTICWLYGQGFPKSHNIGKAIDKKAGKEREVIGQKYEGLGCKRKKSGTFGDYKGPSDLDGLPITAPATSEAELWEGYGTALKPAFEPIIVAMKPIDETYVNNALTHGVAGLWIDGGRISTQEKLIAGGNLVTNSGDDREGKALGMFQKDTPNTFVQNNNGRWPANVILSHHPDCKQTDETITVDGYTINRWKDNAHPFGGGAGNEYESEHKEDEEIAVWECVEDCPIRLLNEQTGTLRSGDSKGFKGEYTADVYGKYAHNQINPETVYADSGGASRFFYCAKANKKERNAGLDELPDKEVAYSEYRNNYKETKDFVTHYPDGTPRPVHPTKNSHPTVKPLALMEYLCKLTRTPTGGIVLDPFMGSGTAGMACVNTDRSFIGIEMDEEYVEIAKKRINHAKDILKVV